MIIEVLTADTGAGVGVGVVAPAKDTGAGDIERQQIAEPVDTIVRGPGLVAVAIEAMHGDDAKRTAEVSQGRRWQETLGVRQEER
jgi:hypothetical protein